MTILYVLLVVLVAVSVTTITSLYDLTYSYSQVVNVILLNSSETPRNTQIYTIQLSSFLTL